MLNENEPSDSTVPSQATAASPAPPMRSVHTSSFSEILERLGISLVVTTYQAGKLVLIRPEPSADGPVVNTHFRDFRKPMGFAYEPGRFALGTASEIWEFHDIPAVARKLNGPRVNDAVFVPRSRHITGDIQIHEMVWVPSVKSASPSGSANPSQLCFVNTRFSCLATRSDVYSFVPIWQPPFISALTPEDRCHLNGVCRRDSILRYVTALGNMDTAGGWRENKKSGGIVMDIRSAEIIAHGLSMPHSPRWHDGKLWILESGNGGIGTVDERDGRYQEVCHLPGFTRGLSFAGPYAFVGLSQVRETAVFSGIAIAEKPQEDRCCGVWVVDTRIGKVAGFVKFTDAVQEVFAVHVLSGLTWPEVLVDDDKMLAETYELPDAALRKVPASIRSSARGLGEKGSDS